MSPPIVIEGLQRSFEGVNALRGVSLQVEQGELFGVVGPDGAGKTTLIRSVAGLVGRDAGRVRVLETDPLRPTRAMREALGLMPQEYSLYGDLTVAENLRFFGRLFCLTASQFRERARRLLRITRLERFQERRARALSGGMYKKLALASALLHEPRVLLLDEPTNGVDPVSRRELWELLYGFAAEGVTLLISTPYMDEAARCHRVALVHEGEVLDRGEPNALLAGMSHEAFRVEGSQRDALEPELDALPQVVARSPAGPNVRIVVEPGQRARVAAALHGLGARLQPARLDFEDLFLVRIAQQRRQAS